MVLDKKQRRKKLGNGEILQEASPDQASTISSCLDQIKIAWKKQPNTIAGIWNDWPKLAGDPLSLHCKPLSLRRGVLTVGASHPQWLQALQYSRPQLIARLRAEGNRIKELRIQQYHPLKTIRNKETDLQIWEKHPSRVDIHGITTCNECNAPAPSGEIKLWGMCGFCRRKLLSNEVTYKN